MEPTQNLKKMSVSFHFSAGNLDTNLSVSLVNLLYNINQGRKPQYLDVKYWLIASIYTKERAQPNLKYINY